MKTILCYHYTMEVGLSLGIRGRHNTTGRLLAVNGGPHNGCIYRPGVYYGL